MENTVILSLLSATVLHAVSDVLHITDSYWRFCACLPDEETPGLYGFLHVIVHSAKGFKESASKCNSTVVHSIKKDFKNT